MGCMKEQGYPVVRYGFVNTLPPPPPVFFFSPYISLEWGFSIRAGWSDSTSQNREKRQERGKKRLPQSVQNKTVMHFPPPSSILSFPFLSFFFAAVKIGFSLLVNAGGACFGCRNEQGIMQTPFSECEIPPETTASCEWGGRRKE